MVLLNNITCYISLFTQLLVSYKMSFRLTRIVEKNSHLTFSTMRNSFITGGVEKLYETTQMFTISYDPYALKRRGDGKHVMFRIIYNMVECQAQPQWRVLKTIPRNRL